MTYQKILKNISCAYPCQEDAEAVLSGMESLLGFQYGYIDLAENRIVSFHKASDIPCPVGKGQSLVLAPVAEHAY